MAEVPREESAIVREVYKALEAQQDKHRPHLGASLIGDACERRIWYVFRWAKKERLDGRMLRLFRRGLETEAPIMRDLRLAGMQIEEVDASGQQHRVHAIGGHFGGSMDGVGLGVPEARKTWHVIECKTHNRSSFNALLRNGVKTSKPRHWVQCNTYMGLAGIERALYVAECKDTSELYSERLRFDPDRFASDMAKAERVIRADRPPARCATRPTDSECASCVFKLICWGGEVPEVNCRTCAHATPVIHSKCVRIEYSGGNSSASVHVQNSGADVVLTLTDSAPTALTITGKTLTQMKGMIEAVSGWTCTIADESVGNDAGGPWHCAVHDDEIPLDFQYVGCKGHRYIPPLLEPSGAKVVSADGTIVTYDVNGREFKNGDGDGDTVSSGTIYETGAAKLVFLPDLVAVRKQGFADAKLEDVGEP